MDAIQRTRRRLISAAPPPSPIATARGSRSAAVDDRILTEFLEKSLKIPDLRLPESQIPLRIPAEIDLPKLLSRDRETGLLLLQSVADLGAFQLTGHGISGKETESVIEGSDLVFRIPAEDKRRLPGSFQRRGGGVREDFRWRGEETKKEIARSRMQKAGADTLRAFGQRLETMITKLEVIAEEVGGILHEHLGDRFQNKRVPDKDLILCIHKYSHPKEMLEGSGAPILAGAEKDEEEESSSLHRALNLHLCCQDLQFHIRSCQSSVSFNVHAGAIVVTVGKQLQEWTGQGGLDHVVGEPMFEPGIDADPSFTIEFLCSPSTLPTAKTVSLIDQMLVAIVITLLLCSIWTHISSKTPQIT